MKVYLVLEYEFGENCRVIGSYSTQEGAEKRLKRLAIGKNINEVTYHIISKSIKGIPLSEPGMENKLAKCTGALLDCLAKLDRERIRGQGLCAIRESMNLRIKELEEHNKSLRHQLAINYFGESGALD